MIPVARKRTAFGHGTRFGGRCANTVNELQARFVVVVGTVVVVIEIVTRASGLASGLQLLKVPLQLTRRGVAAALLDRAGAGWEQRE